MELVLGAAIGIGAAIVALAVELIVRSLARRSAGPSEASRSTVALSVQASEPAPSPDSAASTDWIRNTIGAPSTPTPKVRARGRGRARCPVCRAPIVKGADVCRSCGALVST